MAVQRDVSVCAYSLETQEVMFANKGRCRKGLAEYGLAMQVAVLLLNSTIVVVEIDGDIDCSSHAVAPRNLNSPMLVETLNITMPCRFRFREVHLAFA